MSESLQDELETIKVDNEKIDKLSKQLKGSIIESISFEQYDFPQVFDRYHSGTQFVISLKTPDGSNYKLQLYSSVSNETNKASGHGYDLDNLFVVPN